MANCRSRRQCGHSVECPTCPIIVRGSQQVSDVPHPALCLRLAAAGQEECSAAWLRTRKYAEGEGARPEADGRYVSEEQ